ncbi:MAG: NFACT RNA binding domain-containing protein, partial [Pseudomonadota bacterium]
GHANAERYYKQSRKLTIGRKHAESRLAATRRALAERRSLFQRLAELSDDELHRLVAQKLKARQRRPSDRTERLPYREYRSLSGDPIWVGRSAADNDTLTFRFARGNDLWLHTRDAAGPHVIVRLGRQGPFSEATLLDAATLAAHFSPLASEAQVDVSYTFVKNLRKPRAAAAGLVFVSEAKTLRVRLERVRLERLLSSPEDGDDRITD